MTLNIDTSLGSIRLVPQFKVSRRLLSKIGRGIQLAIEDANPVDALLDKIRLKVPWADQPRGTLVAYMTGQGWTQKRLSQATGIPQGHISQMIHGKRAIGPVVAKKLGKALGVDYRKFL
jgi:hypothetical protein